MFVPCRYHKWVSEEALLEACFIGIVAAQQEDSEAVTADADPATAPRTVLSGGRNAGRRMRIAWDETNLAANDSELGLLRPFQKIEQPETPFLYAATPGLPRTRRHSPRGASPTAQPPSPYHRRAHRRYYDQEAMETDGAADLSMAIYSKYLPTYLPPAALDAGAPAGPREMDADALQSLLGMVETDEQGEALNLKSSAASNEDVHFASKRQASRSPSPQLAPIACQR